MSGAFREATGDAGVIGAAANPEQDRRGLPMLLADADLRHDIGFAPGPAFSPCSVEQSLAIFGDLYREVTGRITSAPVLERQSAHGRERAHRRTAGAALARSRSVRFAPLPDRKESPS